MADPSAEYSRLVRDNYLGRALLESFMDGIYTVIVAATLYAIIVKRGHLTEKKTMLSVVLIQYTFAIIHLAGRWWLVRETFITHGDTAGSAFTFLSTLPRWFLLLSGISSAASIVLADCILIWRCWTVWSYRWKVIVIPALSMAAQAGTLAYNLALEVFPTSDYHHTEVLLVRTDVASTSLSFFTTLTATALIVYRIVDVGRIAGMRGYQWSAVEIVVESAMLYLIALIFEMVFLWVTVPYDGYALAALAAITGIAPTLIIARVSLGLARSNDTWSKPTSALRFGSSRNPVASHDREASQTATLYDFETRVHASMADDIYVMDGKNRREEAGSM